MADKPRTIVVALDGSKHSQWAFNWFCKNLYHKNDKVVITHCTEQFHLQPTDFLGVDEMSVDELYQNHLDKSKEIAKSVQKMARDQKIPVKIEELHGHPGHSIVQAASANKAGMIVVGSRGQSLLRRTIMGSVSDYILHHAHMPVIVCKHDDEQAKLLGASGGIYTHVPKFTGS